MLWKFVMKKVVEEEMADWVVRFLLTLSLLVSISNPCRWKARRPKRVQGRHRRRRRSCEHACRAAARATGGAKRTQSFYRNLKAAAASACESLSA